MSRRQSRVSIDSRQHDTLLEFENFKKKFLLANKHITKLNSTLSVRIEELNAQISTLYVENLRLRASEIALASQLKRERERSSKIIAEAEAATHSLIKHLGHIRKSFHVPFTRSSSPEEPAPRPRAKRPVSDPNASPPSNRLARPPTVPEIYEDDETNMSSPEDPDDDVQEEKDPTPVRRRKTKPRTSDSRLPILTRVVPSPVEISQVVLEEQVGKTGKRQPTRRQSGLLASMSITTVTTSGIDTGTVSPRPPSPAFGSPLRRDAILAEEEDVPAVVNGEDEEEEVEVLLQAVSKRIKKEKKKEKEKDKERHREFNTITERPRERERKRSRDAEEPGREMEGSKSKLKDVTNSRVSQPLLFNIDQARNDSERQYIPDDTSPIASGSGHTSSDVVRSSLLTPAAKPASDSSHLLTPRTSSPIPPAPDPEPTGGRERRVRKSINYAEPKLNTKMRKPDPPGASKRSSTSSSDGRESRGSPDQIDPQYPPSEIPPTVGIKRKKSRAYVLPEDGEESEGTQADAEYGGVRGGSDWVNMEGRRRSVQGSSTLKFKRLEGDDSRRHSMAV
ncbi:uncharacterized protein FIBRA_06724 [Fibroporia radiculosa]|uniref:Shugoshin C-terminal domain-containing protein n=1 Tax=Fibroporia radiculosa TaxID=599839 RepID=J4GCB6_9APHY|nr:uncharacterized protein FIBRA_06724 [Fibroporia radiculosa]CCM04543.1 predicted protein [Fibroporia radiculosa]